MVNNTFKKENYIVFDDKNYKKNKEFIMFIYAYSIMFAGLILSVSFFVVSTLNTVAFIALLILGCSPILFIVFRLLAVIYKIDDGITDGKKFSLFYFLNNMVSKSLTYTDISNVDIKMKHKTSLSVLVEQKKKGLISDDDFIIFKNYLDISGDVPLDKQKEYLQRKFKINFVEKDFLAHTLFMVSTVTIPLCLIFAYSQSFGKILLYMALIYLALNIVKHVDLFSKNLLFWFDYSDFKHMLYKLESPVYMESCSKEELLFANNMLYSNMSVVYAFQFLLDEHMTADEIKNELRLD